MEKKEFLVKFIREHGREPQGKGGLPNERMAYDLLNEIKKDPEQLRQLPEDVGSLLTPLLVRTARGQAKSKLLEFMTEHRVEPRSHGDLPGERALYVVLKRWRSEPDFERTFPEELKGVLSPVRVTAAKGENTPKLIEFLRAYREEPRSSGKRPGEKILYQALNRLKKTPQGRQELREFPEDVRDFVKVPVDQP